MSLLPSPSSEETLLGTEGIVASLQFFPQRHQWGAVHRPPCRSSLHMSFWWYWLSSPVFGSVSVAARGSAGSHCQMLFHSPQRWYKERNSTPGTAPGWYTVWQFGQCKSYVYGDQPPACKAVGLWHLSSCSQRLCKHLSWNGQQCYTSVIGAGADVTFFGELDEVTLLPLWYLLHFPDLIEKRVEQLHICPDVNLQCLCWDVVRSRSLAISQLLDSILNLLLCGCTTVDG